MKPTYPETCSLTFPRNHCVAFAVNQEYVNKAAYSGRLLEVIYLEGLQTPIRNYIRWIPSDNPLWDFIEYHNQVMEEIGHKPHEISEFSKISSQALIGKPGMRYATKDNRIISMFHSGNVVIKAGVEIGPLSSIARGTLDSTVIEENCKIGHGVLVGHNCIIGKRNILTDTATVYGSVHTGNDCYISGNTIIRDHLTLADNTFIGMGSVVTKSILEPGWIYVGNPAKPLRKLKDGERPWV